MSIYAYYGCIMRDGEAVSVWRWRRSAKPARLKHRMRTRREKGYSSAIVRNMRAINSPKKRGAL